MSAVRVPYSSFKSTKAEPLPDHHLANGLSMNCAKLSWHTHNRSDLYMESYLCSYVGDRFYIGDGGVDCKEPYNDNI